MRRNLLRPHRITDSGGAGHLCLADDRRARLVDRRAAAPRRRGRRPGAGAVRLRSYFWPFLIRFARNSPSSFQVFPSGCSASPSQWNESEVISVKRQRIGVLSAWVPIWTTSLPLQRPISSSRLPVTGLIHVTRQACIAGSDRESVV